MRISLKEEVTRWKYWVHLYFNQSGEMGGAVVTELDQGRQVFGLFHAGQHREVSNFALS
jgi:hypothetical protein